MHSHLPRESTKKHKDRGSQQPECHAVPDNGPHFLVALHILGPAVQEPQNVEHGMSNCEGRYVAVCHEKAQ
jgi:hypothetical protein